MGRPSHRWEDNIRMDLTEIGISAKNWVDSVQGDGYWTADENTVLNLWFP